MTFNYDKGNITETFKNVISYNVHEVNVAKKWVEQRIQNEATALQFIKENTAISVPVVCNVDEGKDGCYLTMEDFEALRSLKLETDATCNPYMVTQPRIANNADNLRDQTLRNLGRGYCPRNSTT